MDKLERYDPTLCYAGEEDAEMYNTYASMREDYRYGSYIHKEDLLSWIEEHRPHMGDAQVLIKLIEELRK
jgi:hypothetical protein